MEIFLSNFATFRQPYTASWEFIHRITAFKKHQYRNTANPYVPLMRVSERFLARL